MEMLNTELDAINLALSAIGREPVATLDTADLDAAMARSLIQQNSHDIQLNGGRGWWFNRETKWKLTPDSGGTIHLPNNTLSILQARAKFFDQGDRLTMRGAKVYDTDDHTYDMRHNLNKEGNIEFTLLLLLSYEDMPPSARQAVAWRSRRMFSDDTVGDKDMHQINMRNEQQALASLEQEHRRTQRHNYLRDNQLINSRLGLIGGHNNMYR